MSANSKGTPSMTIQYVFVLAFTKQCWLSFDQVKDSSTFFLIISKDRQVNIYVIVNFCVQLVMVSLSPP